MGMIGIPTVGDPTQPVKRDGVDQHGNTIVAPRGPYMPKPTDAVMMPPGMGQPPMPANPMFFVSLEEGGACLRRLLASGVVPANAKLVDHPEALGPVVYGLDGRRVWCIDCVVSVANPDGPGSLPVNISTPVGMILWMEYTYPNKRLYADPSQCGITMRVAD